MTSMLERAPSVTPFVTQTVRVGEQCVDLTAQRTTCPGLVITPRIDASELGSLRLVDGLALVHRRTGTVIAAGWAEALHDLAERLSTVDWDSVGGDVGGQACRLFSEMGRAGLTEHTRLLQRPHAAVIPALAAAPRFVPNDGRSSADASSRRRP
jgi:hypothetical protein